MCKECSTTEGVDHSQIGAMEEDIAGRLHRGEIGVDEYLRDMARVDEIIKDNGLDNVLRVASEAINRQSE